MNTTRWFDRQFDFRFAQENEKNIYDRLKDTGNRLEQIIHGIPENILIFRPAEKWSIKEHAGHLCLLESLWRKRFMDIKHGKEVLTPADLENKATTESGFNSRSIRSLSEFFKEERNATLLLFDNMLENDKIRISLHPRLQQPMRMIDLAYFIVEHDDHHIAVVNLIIDSFKSNNQK